MKKRLEKKAEKLRRKKIHEILDIVLDINTTQERLREATGIKPTAFFEFSGHVPCLDVTIHEHGWAVGSGYEASCKRYSGRTDKEGYKGLCPMLKAMKKERELLKRAGQV